MDSDPVSFQSGALLRDGLSERLFALVEEELRQPRGHLRLELKQELELLVRDLASVTLRRIAGEEIDLELQALRVRVDALDEPLGLRSSLVLQRSLWKLLNDTYDAINRRL